MSEQEKREQGYYWVRLTPGSGLEPAEWLAPSKRWRVLGLENAGIPHEIGPRVQHDSEVVRERDELLAELKRHFIDTGWQSTKEIIARIESQKSGVKP